jgi:hypothetical protein
MCRKFHGAAYATFASVERAKFRWLRGEDSLKRYTAQNGTTRTFCMNCGSSLSFSSPRAPDSIIELALAAFDGEVPVKPTAHIFVGSGANWVTIPAGESRFVEGRDGPALDG